MAKNADLSRPGIGAYIGVGFGLLIFLGAGTGLDESRDLLGELDREAYVAGYVSTEAATVQSAFFKRPSVFYRSLEEEGKDDEDGVTFRTKSNVVQAVPFEVVTAQGPVSVTGKARSLTYPGSAKPRLKQSKYARFSEWTLEPGQSVTILGRARAGAFRGRIDAYRGTPEQWRDDVKSDAASTVLVMLFALLLFTACGGWMAWRYIALVLGARPSGVSGRRELTRPAPELMGELTTVDLDWVERPEQGQGWFEALCRLAGAALISGVFLVCVAAAAARLAPIFWGGLSPFDGEGGVRLAFAHYAASAAVLCAIVWGVREGVSLYFQQHGSPENQRISDVVLQLVARIVAVGGHGDVRLHWKGADCSIVMRVSGERLNVRIREVHSAITLTAHGQGRQIPDGDDGLACKFTPHGKGWKCGPHELDDLAVGAAEQLRAWLAQSGLDLRASLPQLAGRIDISAGDVEHAELSPLDAEVTPRSGVGVLPIARPAGVWRTRNADGLLYLAGALVLVAIPTALSLALTLGWLTAPSPMLVFVPMAFIPGVAFLFRPPSLGPLRNRQVRRERLRLRLKGASLSLAGVSLDLHQPFRIHLTREDVDAETSLLGVELRPLAAGRERAVQFSVPMRADCADHLPELQRTAPLLAASAFCELWPALRICAQAHGNDVRRVVSPIVPSIDGASSEAPQ